MNKDTTYDVSTRQHEIFKVMPGEEKIRIAMSLSDFVRDLALDGLKNRYPQASESECRLLFIKEVHGLKIPQSLGKKSHE
jgi:hypothetical protein